jgi:predicted RNA-binding Zn ribbon-like protein
MRTIAAGKARRQGNLSEFPRLLGETLCLDFTNTVEARLSEHPQDFLTGPVELARWARHADVIDEADAERIAGEMAADPAGASNEWRRAVALREHAYALLRDIAAGRAPADVRVDALQPFLCASLGRAHLRPGAGRFELTPPDGIAYVADLIVLDLHRLLTSERLGRLRQCPGCGDCGWLFLDTSRNGTRHWCSMEGCGSRAKMRRHYQRMRQN